MSKEIKFGDLVRVKSGFYEGCKGIVHSRYIIYPVVKFWKAVNYYTIEIKKIDIGKRVITESEDNLEVIKHA